MRVLHQQFQLHHREFLIPYCPSASTRSRFGRHPLRRPTSKRDFRFDDINKEADGCVLCSTPKENLHSSRRRRRRDERSRKMASSRTKPQLTSVNCTGRMRRLMDWLVIPSFVFYSLPFLTSLFYPSLIYTPAESCYFLQYQTGNSNILKTGVPLRSSPSPKRRGHPLLLRTPPTPGEPPRKRQPPFLGRRKHQPLRLGSQQRRDRIHDQRCRRHPGHGRRCARDHQSQPPDQARGRWYLDLPA